MVTVVLSVPKIIAKPWLMVIHMPRWRIVVVGNRGWSVMHDGWCMIDHGGRAVIIAG